MPRPAAPEAVLFDWHGTLVDTFEAMYLAVDDVLRQLDALGLAGRLARSAQRPLAEHRRLLDEVRTRRRLPLPLKDARRVSRTEIFEVLFAGDEAAKHVAHEAFDRRYLAHVGLAHPFEPGVRAMLLGLGRAGIATGVLTNRRRALLTRELADIDGGRWAGLFDVVVCGDDVPRRKPAPDMVRRALDELGMRRGRDTWFVGDSPTDMQAARRAGVTAVFYNGARWEPPQLARLFARDGRPDLVVGDFEALARAVHQPCQAAPAGRPALLV